MQPKEYIKESRISAESDRFNGKYQNILKFIKSTSENSLDPMSQ